MSFPSLLTLAHATSAAAIAAQPFVGRMDKNGADGACVDALRAVLGPADFRGRVVIGEGEKDDAPALYNGETLGSGTGEALDIAVDPLEGTTFCAKALPNAFSVIALAEPGTMFEPGPAFYMDKLVVGPQARGALDPDAPMADRLQALARAKGKAVSELLVYILERPRNQAMIDDILKAGARVSLNSGGDVLGATQALLDGQDVDALMGIGGTPEGVISAVAAKALGGDCFARLAPQLDDETRAVAEAGMDCQRWMGLDELVGGRQVQFCLTGLTDGLILQAPLRDSQVWVTDSLLIEGPSGQLHRLQTEIPIS